MSITKRNLLLFNDVVPMRNHHTYIFKHNFYSCMLRWLFFSAHSNVDASALPLLYHYCCRSYVLLCIFITIFIYLREKKRIRITAISYNQEICLQIATIFLVVCMEIFGKSLLLSFFLVLSSPVFPMNFFCHLCSNLCK